MSIGSDVIKLFGILLIIGLTGFMPKSRAQAKLRQELLVCC